MVKIETPVAISGRDRIMRDAGGRKLLELECVGADTALEQLILARRIAACVNACEHIHTTALEQIVKKGRTLQLALAYSTMEKIEDAEFAEAS